jgi:hypothetical protein
MRCKNCGAILKKDGDLCTKCSTKIRKQKILEQDTNELYRVKKKYSPKYILTRKMLDAYIIFFIIFLLGAMSGYARYAILAVIGLIIVMFTSLVIEKKNAKKTYMIFYDTKIVLKGKMYFMDVERTLAYSDIKDVVFTQGNGIIERFFQKIFKIGNIYVYPKKGNIISNGLQIEIVGNFDKVIEDVKNIVGEKLSNG